MAAQFQFRELVDEPFGPYRDEEILNKSFPPRHFVPTLETLMLECGDTPIGFDDSEFILPPPEHSWIAQNPVQFSGILRIESLDWLSPGGKQRLEAELRERDIELHRHLTTSPLSLAGVYGNGKATKHSTIRVIINCVKCMFVEYMTSNKHPNSFLIHSAARNDKNHTQMYHVASLDTLTFQKSQNFIARYRLWALIKAIIETDPDRTPLEKRTIDWLANEYLTRIGPTRDELRLPDSDTDRQGEKNTKRYLRHVSRSEVKGHFAAQAEWLLAQQLAPTHRNLWKINIKKWIKFCMQVRRAREEALRNNSQWGLPFGMQEVRDVPLAVQLSEYGGTRKFWEQKLQNIKDKVKSRRQLQRQMASDSEEEEATLGQRVEAAVTFHYDSDFSEASTPPGTDSEDEHAYAPPELVARVPRFCWFPPEMASGSFSWDCPGCSYSIDFLNLKPKDLEVLPHELAEFMERKCWKSIHDDDFQSAFIMTVSQHYTWHMRRNGVELVRRDGKVNGDVSCEMKLN
ncbi:hypothetical protein AX17_000752 [Amanita inopinata Kibby_2008]|nr:hypothetical protein AX17_000752 [Amanita inopinata Kibby_2008]